MLLFNTVHRRILNILLVTLAITGLVQPTVHNHTYHCLVNSSVSTEDQTLFVPLRGELVTDGQVGIIDTLCREEDIETFAGVGELDLTDGRLIGVVPR